ncbi:alpha_adaptinC2 domain-containing protein, partial [Haematococcus lacustris]
AISVALHLEIEGTMLTSCVAALGRFLSVKDPNVRYLALETLSRLALLPDVLDAIRHHQATVLASLK